MSGPRRYLHKMLIFFTMLRDANALGSQAASGLGAAASVSGAAPNAATYSKTLSMSAYSARFEIRFSIALGLRWKSVSSVAWSRA